VVKTWAQTEQNWKHRRIDRLRATPHPSASCGERGAVLVAKTWGAKAWGIGLGVIWGLGLMTEPALGQTQAPQYLTDSEANPSGGTAAQDTLAQDTLACPSGAYSGPLPSHRALIPIRFLLAALVAAGKRQRSKQGGGKPRPGFAGAM